MDNLQKFKAPVDLIDTEALLSQPASKYNETVKMTEADRKAGVKIFCKEPYAQELYDAYNRYFSGDMPSVSKDLRAGQVCKVVAKQVDFDSKTIIVQDNSTYNTLYVPFREFSHEPALLVHGETDREFKVVVYKTDNGEYYASERKCAALSHREDLDEFQKTDQWFYIKVNSLVKGGYLCTYKGGIKCFLPGSHAAANVIRDFNDYLNKEIPVMIENYDHANDLYIVSYKKYIKHTMPERIHELKIGQKYTGTLTNKPYDFGMFVEFQNYFTGLLHKTEFSNYSKETAEFRSGDSIDFFIKDIVMKKGEPRIILTTSADLVNQEKLAWQELKDSTEGKELEYTFDKDKFSVEIFIGGAKGSFNLDVSHLKGKMKIANEGLLVISQVDIVRNHVHFDFVD